jgi:hypothetical protein
LHNWGLGIGDWGLGIGDWAQSPIPIEKNSNEIFIYIINLKILYIINIYINEK